MKTTNMKERMKANLVLLLIHVEQSSDSSLTSSYRKELNVLAQLNIIQLKPSSLKEKQGVYHYHYPEEQSFNEI